MPQIIPFIAGSLGLAGSAAIATSAAYAAGVAFSASILGRLLMTVAFSALSQALQPKSKTRPAGIRTTTTTSGGVNSASFVLGSYATAGNLVAPDMTHGSSGGTPNAFLTRVIDLGDVAGHLVTGLFLDGKPMTIGTTAHPDYGFPITSTGVTTGGVSGAWIKHYDGTQTVADPMLLAKYGSDPDFPWTADMVGTGVPYAILTFQYNRKIFSNIPQPMFITTGTPLYDPRLDSSVGGTGTQRWATPSTWLPSNNPIVQVYNIFRGIDLGGGNMWGVGTPASNLPLAEFFAAMNACDVSILMADGSTEPAYRSGFEVHASDEPADIVPELLKACSGQMVEIGGVWKIRVGGPGLPVKFITDDDVIISAVQELDPFPPLAKTYNGIHASYPEPISGWSSKDAPPRYNSTYETADQGRRLVANLALSAVPYRNQVQRLMYAYIEEERRFRRHIFTLPPDAAALEPLDSISYTSARNGYTAKIFELSAVEDNHQTMLQRVTLRERDSSDYAWSNLYEMPSVPSATIRTPPSDVVPTPTGVSAIGQNKQATVSWSNPVYPRFSSVDVYASSTNLIAGAIKVGSVAGTTFVHQGLTNGTAMFYWLQLVNDLGDLSLITASVSATPNGYGKTDFASTNLSTTFDTIGTFTSGIVGTDRVVIKDDVIQVIDAANVIRVKLGNLV